MILLERRLPERLLLLERLRKRLLLLPERLLLLLLEDLLLLKLRDPPRGLRRRGHMLDERDIRGGEPSVLHEAKREGEGGGGVRGWRWSL